MKVLVEMYEALSSTQRSEIVRMQSLIDSKQNQEKNLTAEISQLD